MSTNTLLIAAFLVASVASFGSFSQKERKECEAMYAQCAMDEGCYDAVEHMPEEPTEAEVWGIHRDLGWYETDEGLKSAHLFAGMACMCGGMEDACETYMMAETCHYVSEGCKADKECGDTLEAVAAYCPGYGGYQHFVPGYANEVNPGYDYYEFVSGYEKMQICLEEAGYNMLTDPAVSADTLGAFIAMDCFCNHDGESCEVLDMADGEDGRRRLATSTPKLKAGANLKQFKVKPTIGKVTMKITHPSKKVKGMKF